MEFGEARATLNFHNSETNSYISLFTSALKKPEGQEDMGDKAFENDLMKCFRHVNENVVQVNVFPAFNKTYVARVYLKTEEAGKDFIVDFPTKREFLHKYYKDNNNIKFNINVDDKTMKKIKVMQKRAGHITSNIKNETDNQKRAKKPQNQIPIYGQPPMMMQGGMGMMGMGMPPMGSIPNMPNMGGMPPPMGMNRNMPPGPPGPGNFMGNMQPPMMGGPANKMIPSENPDAMIPKFIADRNKLVESAKDPNNDRSIRSSLAPSIRHVLGSKLNVQSTDAHRQMSKFIFNIDIIVKENDIGTIIDFLANPQDQYSKIKK